MLRVRMALTGWPGGPGLSTFYFDATTDDVVSAARAVGCVQSAVTGHWKNVWPLTVHAQVSGDVDVIDRETGDITDTLSVDIPASVAGAGASEYAPIATALVLSLTTGTFIAGRRLRGRIFFSPVANNMVQADGTPMTTAIGFIEGGGADVLEFLTEGDAWVVWHRPVNGAGGQTGRIVSSVCHDKFGILRSRRD